MQRHVKKHVRDSGSEGTDRQIAVPFTNLHATLNPLPKMFILLFIFKRKTNPLLQLPFDATSFPYRFSVLQTSLNSQSSIVFDRTFLRLCISTIIASIIPQLYPQSSFPFSILPSQANSLYVLYSFQTLASQWRTHRE